MTEIGETSQEVSHDEQENKKSRTPQLHFQPSPDLSSEDRELVEQDQSLFRIVNGFSQFADYYQRHPLDKISDSNKILQKFSRDLRNMVKTSRMVSNYMQNEASYSRLRDDEQELQTLIPKDENAETVPIVEIPIHSRAEIYAQRRNIERLLHDLKNTLGNPFNSLQFLERKPDSAENLQDFLESFAEAMPRFQQNITTSIEQMLGKYVKQEISRPHIMSALRKSMQGTIERSNEQKGEDERIVVSLPYTDSTQFSQDHPEVPRAVMWNDVWMYTLFENLAQNAERAGARHVDIRFGEHVDDQNGKYLAIQVLTDGQPFIDDLLEHGFQEGVTSWQDSNVSGTGIGMAAHMDVLKNHYGGGYKLSNDINPHTGRLGAVQEFYIPAKE